MTPGAALLAFSLAHAADVALPPGIAPLLETHCVACHEGARAKGGFELASVLESARASGRVEESILRQLRRRLAKRDMPPADEPERPTVDEYAAAVRAIDAAVPPESREVPAVRRLNRAQYAGAVRDVLGCDEALAQSLLPRDEIGEGFDTTAATLALPPLLIEKYFDAAERIAEECVPPESWSERRVFQPERLVRRGQGHAGDGIAWLATNGSLSARVELARAGKYRVTVEAVGQLAGDESPRLEAFVGARAFASIGVTAPPGAPQVVLGELELAPGVHEVVARFTNDFWDPKNPDPKRRDRNLGIGRIVVEGPLGPTPESAFEARVRAAGGEGADAVRLRRVAAAVGEELFRRPLEKAESDGLAATARAAAGAGASFDDQLRALVTAMLVDPRFLLRVEPASGESPSGRVALQPLDLASRLSFFLWSSVPDAELRRAATAGELADPESMRAQVRRMLADPRAASLARRFATQWLGIDGLESRQLDPVIFPGIDAALLLSMQRETERLFERVVRGERPVRAIIESRTTEVDARLAAHYGLEAPSAGGWAERAIDAARGPGVLGHASVLVATSNPTRTSPVKRGKWVLQALLDDAPPPPPPGVPQLPERPEETKGLPMRELMRLHRENPDCASCHVRMDAIGLAFEGSAADGRLRAAADARTELPDGTALDGVLGIAAYLAKDRAFERAFVRQLLVYALGRGTADADDALVDHLAARLAEQGSFTLVAEEIAVSDVFRTRMSR